MEVVSMTCRGSSVTFNMTFRPGWVSPLTARVMPEKYVLGRLCRLVRGERAQTWALGGLAHAGFYSTWHQWAACLFIVGRASTIGPGSFELWRCGSGAGAFGLADTRCVCVCVCAVRVGLELARDGRATTSSSCMQCQGLAY